MLVVDGTFGFKIVDKIQCEVTLAWRRRHSNHATSPPGKRHVQTVDLNRYDLASSYRCAAIVWPPSALGAFTIVRRYDSG